MASQDQVRFQEQLNELVRDGKLSMSEFTRIQGDMNKMTNEQVKATRTLVAELARTNKEQQKRANIEQTIKDLESDQLDLASKLQKATQGNIKSLQGVHSQAKDITNQYIKTLDQAVKTGQISKQQAADLKAQAIETAKMAKNIDKIASSGMAEAFDAAQDATKGIASGIESAIKSIPGGGMLFNMLGGPQLQQQLSQGVTAGFSAMAKSMSQGVGLMGSLRAGMAAFNAVAAINPILAIVAAAALLLQFLKKIVNAAIDFSGQVQDTSKNLGVSYAKSQLLEKSIIKMSKEGRNILPEEARTIAEGLNKELGMTAHFSADVAENIATGAVAFGANLDTATQLNAQFIKMGLTATDASETVNEMLREANESGIDVNTVMEDVARTSKTMRHHFKGSVKELTKAVMESRKMGVALDASAGAMDAMTDLEAVFEASMQASTLDANFINMDIEGMMSAAINKEEGKMNKLLIENFKNYEVLDAMAFDDFAKGIGMTAGEIMDMVDANRLMEASQGKINAEQIEVAKSMGLTLKQMLDMDTVDLVKKINDENDKRAIALAQEEARAQSMNKMIDFGGQLVDVLTSPAMQAFYNGIGMVAGFLVDMIKPVFTSIQHAVAPIKEAFSSIAESLGLAGGAGGTLSMIFNTIGATLGLIIDYSLEPMRLIFDEIASKLSAVKQVIGGIGKLFSGDIMGGLKDIGAGIINFFTTPIELLINTVQRFYDRAVKFINDVFGFDIPSFDELFPGLRDFFSNLGDNVMAGLTMAGEYFMNLPGNFIDKIRQGFKDIVAYLKDKINGIVQKVKDSVNPAKAVKKVGSKIKSFFGFADGGIVTGPTAAMIGEAGDTEAVLPLGKFESIFGPILKKMEPGGDKFEKLAAQITGMGANFTAVSQAVIGLASAAKSSIAQATASIANMSQMMVSLIKGTMQRITMMVSVVNALASLTKTLIVGSMQRIDSVVASIKAMITATIAYVSVSRMISVMALKSIRSATSMIRVIGNVASSTFAKNHAKMMAMHASLGSIHSQMRSVLHKMERAAIRMYIHSPSMSSFRSLSSRRRPKRRDENSTSLSDVVSAINRLHVAIENIDIDMKMDGTRVAEMVYVNNSYRKR